jgi:hypothetical protein
VVNDQLFKKCNLLKELRGHEVTPDAVSNAISMVNKRSREELCQHSKTITTTSCDPHKKYREWQLYTKDVNTSCPGEGHNITHIDLLTSHGANWKTDILTLSIQELDAICEVIITFSDLQSGRAALIQEKKAKSMWNNGCVNKNVNYGSNIKALDGMITAQARIQQRVLDELKWMEKHTPWPEEQTSQWTAPSSTSWSSNQWGSSSSGWWGESSSSEWSSKKRSTTEGGWDQSSWSPKHSKW